MRRFLLGTFCIVISVISIIVINNFVLKDYNAAVHVSAAIFGTDSSTVIPSETGAKGTTTNPFIVLEIVPYEGYAEVGYMIKGCEPVPMDKVEFSSEDCNAVASTTGLSCVWEAQYSNTLPKEGVGTAPGQWERLQTGYRRYHNAITYNNKFLINTLHVPANQVDDYKIQVVTITPKELNQPEKQAWIDRADLIYISPRSHFADRSLIRVWEKYHPEKIVSNPPTSFVRNDFTWETTVKLLRKASSAKNYAPIIFDVIVFTEDSSYNKNITPDKRFSTGESVSNSYNLSSKGYITNVAKLYMIMQQMEPAKFVREYIDTNRVVSVKMKENGNNLKNGNIDMTTGYDTEQKPANADTYYTYGAENTAAVWSVYTLLPFQLFKDYAAIKDGSCWTSIGIDNYKVNLNGDVSNVSVWHNMYSYNGDNVNTILFDDKSKIPLNDYTSRAFEYYKKTSGTLSPAEAVHYLLNLQQFVYKKDLIRILEIEPCNDYIWDGTAVAWNVINGNNGSPDTRKYFTNFFPHFKGNVSITKMTSSEFIGKIDDLNSNYDLIFFGLKDVTLRKNATTTLYNDNDLNGRVYLHNGDIIRNVNAKLRGLAGTNTADTYRFSGNDITALKLQQLKKFMEGGNPIILDKGFYTNSSRTIINSGSNGKLDPNSNINDLANLNYSQLFYADGINTNEVEDLLCAAKCKIIFGKKDNSSVTNCYPNVYKDRTLSEFAGLSDSQIDQKIYINGGTDPNFRTLQYMFYIDDNNLGDDYKLQLYIDINADGKFDEATENISGLSILNDKGYKVNWDELKAGENYTLTRTLKDEYFGVLPWKLVVKSKSNENVTDSAINYCAIKAQNKIKLNILQIKSDTKNTVDLSTDNPERQPVFQKYIKALKDYDVKITSMTVSEFSQKCGTNAYTYLLSDDNDDNGRIEDNSRVAQRIDDDGDGKYDFDMLILGFADMYSDVSNPNELRNFSDFIAEGKTVLFTHDTTSFVNKPETSYSGDDFWGYGLNQYFRNTLGMDRFGVTLAAPAERIAAKKDYASNKSDYSGYIQGYSNMILNRYAPAGQYASNKNITLGSSFEGSFTTNYVTNTNKGQLTTYPYQIEDKFKVATTHAQYYQLDLETNDMVVWYCLSDANNGSGFYSTTPNDVRNNYYIYNKGNITYSGVGHSALNSSLSDTSNHMEVKLFVNTIIAAYSATAKQSQIIITNPNKSEDSNGKEYVYVDYDIYNTQQAVGTEVYENKTGDASTQPQTSSKYQRIKYRVVDDNILYHKELSVKYYYVDPVTNADGSKSTKLTQISDLTTWQLRNSTSVQTSDKGDIIESGEEYYFEIPLSELNNSNSGRTIMIQVLTTYGKASDKTSKSEKSFTLVRRGLFDLD